MRQSEGGIRSELNMAWLSTNAGAGMNGAGTWSNFRDQAVKPYQ
jgi:hypothetical protein